MTLLKCKMCGGDIEAAANQTYGTCSHCGSVTTLPKATDEQVANLFNRANHFRRQNDFDKAMMAYENILNIDYDSAEAHWGLVLSKYGIEYVEDPQTHQRVPTCHRVQNNSILVDEDYLAAIEKAEDHYVKEIYELEAKIISDIQKDILSISSKEAPYDIFICYKETTDGGERTKDSTIAQDVYYQLTNEGYKVFFSRITLEDKIGEQYEPYIFAALNSAKVMIVLGTNQDYFNASWVKNEWRRYLSLSKKDKSKLLIPCYGYMDAYDLPEELSMLQSQDITKIGFMQDLIRGIKKVLDSSKNTTMQNNEKNIVSMTPGAAQLLDRVSIFLEDGDFDSTDEYLNRILDLEPRNAKAYFMKVLTSLKIAREEDLLNYPHTKSLEEYPDFEKALRFADADYKIILMNYNQSIIDGFLEGAYQEAKTKMSKAGTGLDYLLASRLFKDIISYKDSADLADKCQSLADELAEKEKLYQKAVAQRQNAKSKDDYLAVARLFEDMSDYRDSARIAQKCHLSAENEAQKTKYFALKDPLCTRINRLENINSGLTIFQRAKKAEIKKELDELYKKLREIERQHLKSWNDLS